MSRDDKEELVGIIEDVKYEHRIVFWTGKSVQEKKTFLSFELDFVFQYVQAQISVSGVEVFSLDFYEKQTFSLN